MKELKRGKNASERRKKCRHRVRGAIRDNKMADSARLQRIFGVVFMKASCGAQ